MWQIDWLIGWPSRDLSLFTTDSDTVEMADWLADWVAQSGLVPVYNRQWYSWGGRLTGWLGGPVGTCPCLQQTGIQLRWQIDWLIGWPRRDLSLFTTDSDTVEVTDWLADWVAQAGLVPVYNRQAYSWGDRLTGWLGGPGGTCPYLQQTGIQLRWQIDWLIGWPRRDLSLFTTDRHTVEVTDWLADWVAQAGLVPVYNRHAYSWGDRLTGWLGGPVGTCPCLQQTGIQLRWQIDWLIGWPRQDLSLFTTDSDTVEVADWLADWVAQAGLVPVYNRQAYSWGDRLTGWLGGPGGTCPCLQQTGIQLRWQIDWLIGWPSRDLSLFTTDSDTVEVADWLADWVAQSGLVPVYNRQAYSWGGRLTGWLGGPVGTCPCLQQTGIQSTSATKLRRSRDCFFPLSFGLLPFDFVTQLHYYAMQINTL